MNFSIGKKISLLTSILVLCTAIFIASWVLNTSVYHVIDHEVVDLVEETNLSAALMRESLTEFRRRIALLAGTKQFKPELSVALRSGGDIAKALPSLHKDCQQVFADQPGILKIELLRFAPNGELRKDNPVVDFRNAALESLSKPTSQDSLITELLGENERRASLSAFGQAEVVFRKADAGPDDERPIRSEPTRSGLAAILCPGTRAVSSVR